MLEQMNISEISVLPSFNETSYFNETNSQRANISNVFRITRLVLFTLVFLVGLPGHLFVLYITIFKLSSKISYNIFISALSLTDLLVLCVHLPYFVVYVELPHSAIFSNRYICPIFYSISLFAVIASALILIAISYGRFLATEKPQASKLGSKQAFIILFIIFILSFLCILPFSMAMGPMHFPSFNIKVGCFIRPYWWPNTWSRSLTYFTNSFLPSCLIPFFSMTFFYTKIVKSLNAKRRLLTVRGNLSTSAAILRLKRDSKLTRMLIAICISFGVCTLPFQTLMFIISFNVNLTIKLIPVLEISRFLLIANSSLNPLLYSLFSSNFRSHFCSVFKCKKVTSRRSTDGRSRVHPTASHNEMLQIRRNENIQSQRPHNLQLDEFEQRNRYNCSLETNTTLVTTDF